MMFNNKRNINRRGRFRMRRNNYFDMNYSNGYMMNNKPMIVEGATGEQVEELQEKLQNISNVFPSLPIVIKDGYYGNITKSTVKKFQELNSLPVTGYVDSLTWEKINYFLENRQNDIVINKTIDDIDLSDNVIKLGSKGRYVSDLQQYLNIAASKNPNLQAIKVDGVFGYNTEQAVLKFQQAYGLNTDGVVGVITWDALYNISIDEPIEKIDE